MNERIERDAPELQKKYDLVDTLIKSGLVGAIAFGLSYLAHIKFNVLTDPTADAIVSTGFTIIYDGLIKPIFRFMTNQFR